MFTQLSHYSPVVCLSLDSMHPASPDSKLHNRYQLHAMVGQGGAGEVFTAWDTQLERTVAIKRLRKDGIQDDVGQNMWAEAARLASIRHANIVTVYDMGVDDGVPYIVMEYVNGETVESRVAQRGVMDRKEFCTVAEQTLEGLLAAHHAGLLHRDLKPSNLMLTRLPSGSVQVKILDFGIARFLNSGTTTTEKTGSVTGSIHCIAPEILNRDPVDERSDLYSVGCILYYALSGHFPFDGEKISHVIAAHLNHLVVDLAEYRPDLPRELCDWVMALINRWPDNRYSSAMQALAGLHHVTSLFAGDSSSVIVPPNSAPSGVRTGSSVGSAPAAAEPSNDDTSSVSTATPIPKKAGPPWAAIVGAAAVIALGAIYLVSKSGSTQSREVSHDSGLAGNKVTLSAPPAPTPGKAAGTGGIAEPAEPPKIAAVERKPVEATPEPVAATPVPPPPAHVVLRFHGSNTIGAQLLPALIQRFLQKEGATEVVRRPGADHEEMTIEAKFPGEPIAQAVEVAAHGSKTAFDDLVAQKCDVGAASRPIKKEELQSCEEAGLGDLQSPQCEHVLGLDGIAVILNPSNPIGLLTVQQISDIFTGKVTDWEKVGGKSGPIHVFARDAKSGTFDTFKALVLGASPLVADAKRLEDSNELSDDVAADPQAVGFVGLPFVRKAKLIAVSEAGASPFLATRFTVATEDYALSRRLFLYVPSHPSHPWISKFIEFALGDEGQAIVAENGFVKQSIELETPILAPDAPPAYRAAVQNAKRLSLNLRFKKGSTELDNKSIRDLDRISSFVDSKKTGKKIMLFGFTDNQGSQASNLKISKERAQAVAKDIEARGIQPLLVTSFGSAMPVANNDTDQGRDKNRRVEVWIR